MKWAELRSSRFSEISRHTPVILPVAAIEQHGAHLPLNTDTLTATAIAERLDQAMPYRLLVLPTQAVGCSEHHMRFAGSLTLTHDTFRACVTQTLESVVRHGFHRLLILNAHGGNQAINGVILEDLGQRHPQVETVVANWWVVAMSKLHAIQEGGFGSVGHACEFETSIILAIAPHLVDMSQARDDGLQHRAAVLAADLFHAPPASTYRPFHELTHAGVFGTPTLASAQKGERILHVVTESLVNLIDSLWPVSDAGSKHEGT